jgi:hypothetical protein
MMSTEPTPTTKPNGPVAAAFLAAAVGCFVLGLVLILNEAKIIADNALKFDANFGLGSGVGPLSGKVIIATVAFVVTWAVLGVAWRRREVNFNRVFVASLVIVVLGFAMTFPPIFEIFAKK